MSASQAKDTGLLLLREHLGSAAYLGGADSGRWSLIDLSWPFATVAATVGRSRRPSGQVTLRFDLTQYPAVAPTSHPWDLARRRAARE
jgi:hypothetical protein